MEKIKCHQSYKRITQGSIIHFIYYRNIESIFLKKLSLKKMYLGLKEALHLDRNGLKSLPAENVALIDGLIQMKENHKKSIYFSKLV